MDSVVAEKVERFFERFRLRSYSKGQVLLLADDDSHTIYYLLKGKVKQYEVSYHGDEVIVNVYKPPAFFPMSVAINKTLNPYIFEAETDIEVRQAPAEDVVKFLKSNPDVMFDLLGRLYRGVDGLLARMTRLMSSSAKGRLMFEVLVECKRFGKKQKDNSYLINISESDLGARAGLSRETVSREMHKLTEEKLLKVAMGKITVFDLPEFENKLGTVV